MPKTSLSQPDILTLNPNILFFNIILQKAKSDLAYEKRQNTAKLNSIETSFNSVKSKTLSLSAFDEDDYKGKIHNKVKLFASQFVNLPKREFVKIFVNKFCLVN